MKTSRTGVSGFFCAQLLFFIKLEYILWTHSLQLLERKDKQEVYVSAQNHSISDHQSVMNFSGLKTMLIKQKMRTPLVIKFSMLFQLTPTSHLTQEYYSIRDRTTFFHMYKRIYKYIPTREFYYIHILNIINFSNFLVSLSMHLCFSYRNNFRKLSSFMKICM